MGFLSRLMAPQMPPQQGGMDALQSAFSTSPEFQAQLGAIHGQTSPGHMPVQFTPPQTPVPPMNVNTGNTRGRTLGGVQLGGQGGTPQAGQYFDPMSFLRTGRL